MSFNSTPQELIKQNINGVLSVHESWKRTPLNLIGEIINGFAFKSSEFNVNADGNPLIRIRDVLRGSTSTYYSGYVPDGYWVSTGDLIVGMDGDFNSVIWKSKPALLNQRVCKINIDEKKYSKTFFFYALPGYLFAINANTSSTTVKHLSSKTLLDTLFPLPPLAEQKIIADKLDDLLARVESIKTRLENIPEILKKFRQSVLNTAVSGELTKEWRERKTSDLDANADLHVELNFCKENSKKIEVTTYHEIVLEKFPKVWSVASFTNLYYFIDYRGKTPNKSPSGKRLYTAKNIKMGYVSDEPVEYLSELDFRHWMTRGFTRLGDIFFVTEGHTMGFTAMNTVGSDIALAQRTLTLQPYGRLNTKFHYYYMLTNAFQRLIELNATGSAAKGIKAAKFRGLPVPFPSYAEQNEIVRRVDGLLSRTEVLEKRAHQALERIKNITQSILTKAFRGELTAQWREENPELISGLNSAEALLEKITAEKLAAGAVKKRAKKTSH